MIIGIPKNELQKWKTLFDWPQQLVARIEHLSVDVSSMDTSRQLKEDNLLLRKDLQAYQVYTVKPHLTTPFYNSCQASHISITTYVFYNINLTVIQ